ncbi:MULTISPECIES: AmmeMemoRadiSam system radical SAM enzyme [Calditerrivibrio]|uniref:AmmeMemoRadiSam system radical SAM enzyme n=1 Tax=Calditerrivibrio nitroreducens TaxID=477976 RepID=A0A2J6WQ49_9BACT|nr:MAG: AmmeMemoRadiSam system radical SAM enzyme [Calditerrivibrio nitroreducens]
MKEALFYEKLDDKKVRCLLCPHRCIISNEGHGICLIRKNIEGTLHQTSYGEVSSINVDPIEKKPLYHFHPGSEILSIGTNGCNLNCAYCQNFSISKNLTLRQKVTPEELISLAQKTNSIGIAYTYNEPTIWYEFVYDTAMIFQKSGFKNVLVTNGYINSEPLKQLLPYIDAANIDLKAFSEEKYKMLGGSLKEVLNTIETMYRKDIHIEITHLAVENYTTDIKEFDELCRFISSINKSIPLHISRYFPCYKLSLPPTRNEFLLDLFDIAKRYLSFVYLGNVLYNNDTTCPVCGAKIIIRNGYKISSFLSDNRCPICKSSLYFSF